MLEVDEHHAALVVRPPGRAAVGRGLRQGGERPHGERDSRLLAVLQRHDDVDLQEIDDLGRPVLDHEARHAVAQHHDVLTARDLVYELGIARDAEVVEADGKRQHLFGR